jgi:hypothetical protein
MLALLFVVIVVGTVTLFIWLTLRETRQQVAREAFIRHGALPLGLFERLRQKHPQLTQSKIANWLLRSKPQGRQQWRFIAILWG